MRTRRDSGSVLALVPAAVLVLVVLAAIAVDTAVVLLAERDLVNRTAAAANDVAAVAADDAAFYGEGAIRLRADAADGYVSRAFGGPPPAGYDAWGASATVSADGRSVTVEAWAEVRPVFARFARQSTRVEARSTATARQH